MNVATKATIVSVIDMNESDSKGECDDVDVKISIYDRDPALISADGRQNVSYFNCLDNGGQILIVNSQ